MRDGGRVRDWMSRRPVTVSPDWTVAQAVARMRTEGIRHILVMDGDRLAGIVSDRDLRAPSGAGASTTARATSVAEVMVAPVMTIAPDTPVAEAARAMLDAKIGALAVVEDDRPIGILTKSDMLEALLVWLEGPA